MAYSEIHPTPSRTPQRRPRKVTTLLLLSCFLGAVSTGYFLLSQRHPQFGAKLLSAPVLLGALVCIMATTVNVLLRWLRFHFLVRRFTPALIARDSLAIYLATLPTIMSPFSVAELVRVPLIQRRFHTPAAYLLRVWVSERLLDAAVVGACLLLALRVPYAWVAIVASSIALVFWFRGMVTSTDKRESAWVVSFYSLSASVLAWLLPMFALWVLLDLLGASTSVVAAVRAFSSGTLLGGVSGIPLGMSITGSRMIYELTEQGVDSTTSISAVLVYRACTAWYAVILGVFAAWVFRRRLLKIIWSDGAGHFDELSSEYEEEIPEHVRDRLLMRKIHLMAKTLKGLGVPAGARGLDVGCGHGWYLAEMRRLGYQVDGTDYSSGQLRQASEHLRAAGMSDGVLQQADASDLPFETGSYAFVYSINAVHHMVGPGTQNRALREIVRVLQPGGVFLLHEMNTENPLFRWYMGYLFPLLKRIDEGNEEWLRPSRLPAIPGARWQSKIDYFTFLPDFIPRPLLRLLQGVEAWLETSRLRRFSAHYQAYLLKTDEASSSGTSPSG